MTQKEQWSKQIKHYMTVMSAFGSSAASGPMDDEVVLDFGAESDADNRKKFRHPVVVTFHLAFRSLAFIIFLFGGQFSSSSFITPFVFIIIFLCCDFWTVKNVSGRLLVGLRWWNYIDDQGKSHWIFEQAKASSGTSKRKYRSNEVRLFWLSLVVFPLLWLLFFFICLFSPRWLMVAVLGLGMTGANLYGYLRCKFGAHAKMRDVATKFVGQKLMENVFTGKGGSGGDSVGQRRNDQPTNAGVPSMDGNVLSA